jgi:hypothetical protein
VLTRGVRGKSLLRESHQPSQGAGAASSCLQANKLLLAKTYNPSLKTDLQNHKNAFLTLFDLFRTLISSGRTDRCMRAARGGEEHPSLRSSPHPIASFPFVRRNDRVSHGAAGQLVASFTPQEHASRLTHVLSLINPRASHVAALFVLLAGAGWAGWTAVDGRPLVAALSVDENGNDVPVHDTLNEPPPAFLAIDSFNNQPQNQNSGSTKQPSHLAQLGREALAGLEAVAEEVVASTGHQQYTEDDVKNEPPPPPPAPPSPAIILKDTQDRAAMNRVVLVAVLVFGGGSAACFALAFLVTWCIRLMHNGGKSRPVVSCLLDRATSPELWVRSVVCRSRRGRGCAGGGIGCGAEWRGGRGGDSPQAECGLSEGD